MSTSDSDKLPDYDIIYPPHCNTTVNRLRIDGRLHSVGDTVFIPALGYNGTIINLDKNKLEGIDVCLILTLPHDYGTPVTYTPLELRTGAGVSLCIMHHLYRKNVICNDTVRLSNCPTRIHESRDHYRLSRDYHHV